LACRVGERTLLVPSAFAAAGLAVAFWMLLPFRMPPIMGPIPETDLQGII
jgi:hypothetical protein